VWCHSENNAPHHFKNVTFVKGVPDLENPENVPTFIVLDDLMDSAYSAKVSQLFTNGSNHRNISLVLIIQKLFHQGPSSRDISLYSKYIVVFKNPRDKTQIVHLARQHYPENISSFHKTYLDVCKDPNFYQFLYVTQSINSLLRFRTKIFPGKNTELLRLLKVMNRLRSQLHFLQVLKDAKPQARRALLTSANDDLIKAIVECAINTLNGNGKLTKEDKGYLSKYKNPLRALVKPKTSLEVNGNF
jgi:hypothetical protein